MAESAFVHQPFSGLTGSDELQEAWLALHEELTHYLDDNDIGEVLRAAIYGANAHEGQMRQSGEPYFIHPIAVAKILAAQRFDLPVLQGGLLHDVLEDTPITKAEMTAAFGTEVAAIVDGVSKLDRLKDQAPQEVQASSFKKMLVATTDDPRVIIIKLADRLHNMQTLGALRPDKRIRKAKETLDIYASIAGRLGLFYFRMHLEDLAFSHLYPWRYAIIKKHYMARFANSNEIVDQVRHDLLPIARRMGIQLTITKRQRHLWGLYQRMKRKNSFADACRTIPIRIITSTEDDCYRILGILHSCYRPISGKFEDYIAAPKSNGYRSLHTSVLMARRDALNVQIRTRDMHNLAETGIIAVWHQHLKNRTIRQEQHTIAAEKYMRDWLSRLREVQNITDDPLEFYDAIKKELSSGDIHVYTPAGEVIDLPHGATPVDFAYAIHTEIGNHCTAAKVNGRPYPILKPLEAAQTVEIITDKNAHPNIGWLQFVVTAKARAGVNHHLRTLEASEAQNLGRQLLDQALNNYGSSLQTLDPLVMDTYLTQQEIALPALLSDIAYGRRQSSLTAAALLGEADVDNIHEHTLQIHSSLDSGIKLAECCHPLPAEPLLAELEIGKCLRVHRDNCPLIRADSGGTWLRAEWAQDVHGNFPALLQFDLLDRPRMLSAVADAIAESDGNISDFQIEHNAADANIRTFKIWIDVKNRDHLAQIIRRLRLINGITSRIERL